MRAALPLAVAAGLLAPAPEARAEIRVEVRVTEELGISGRAALVEFSPAEQAWVVLYGAFSDGSLRPLGPGADDSPEWMQAREIRVISVELSGGLRLESVQAVASPRWFDPRALWIAAAPGEAGPRVSTEDGEGLWS
jgi:hypothetical protein